MATVWSAPTPPKPFLAFLPPPGSKLDRYDSTLLPQDQQESANIPITFIDAMTVREQVFVREQHIPLKYEFDSDDARSCHWVIYHSTCTQEEAITDKVTGAVTLPESARSTSTPIGTIRLVPFPHPPHPKNGRQYIDGKILPQRPGQDPSSEEDDPNEPQGQAPAGYQDRVTSLHDGKEPYVKLGRLAIIRAHRGRFLSDMLLNAALDWAMTHYSYFDQVRPRAHGPSAEWNGLVCVHAQVAAAKVWQRHSFFVDELMGKWYEEGIPHQGRFRRVERAVDPLLAGPRVRG
ncbi:hypothetical protein CONLIGDRAFT_447112 [Coniochaeta ligniaria NRRL 30616]|uniref:Uncharacterized protein n=1 Tax=Coniochaeta ligniaria NRRL 30616 TaxID=1408157 RepID=A0A1J7IJZ7_9PEZI|nr:hypothetical protein CONLIGDRAFT_447112 [Coniochaeta ligniaria NRRL 30616]